MGYDVAELVKQLALGAIENAKPVAVMVGTVETLSPLTVRIDQKLSLGTLQLVRLQGVSLQVGDAVLLLREQGGQRFVILGVTD